MAPHYDVPVLFFCLAPVVVATVRCHLRCMPGVFIFQQRRTVGYAFSNRRIDLHSRAISANIRGRRCIQPPLPPAYDAVTAANASLLRAII